MAIILLFFRSYGILLELLQLCSNTSSPDYKGFIWFILLQTSPLIEQYKISYRSQMLETYFEKWCTPHSEPHMLPRRRYRNKILTVYDICIDFSILRGRIWNTRGFYLISMNMLYSTLLLLPFQCMKMKFMKR